MSKNKKLKSITYIITTSIFALSVCLFPLKADAAPLQSSELRKSQISKAPESIMQVPNTSSSNKSKSGKIAPLPEKDAQKYSDNELIIKFNPGVTKDIKGNLNKMLSSLSTEVLSVKDLGSTGAMLVKFKGNKNPEELTKLLKYNYINILEYVEPNYKVYATDINSSWTPSDPNYSNLWGLKNTGQDIQGIKGTPGIDINAESAWNITKGSSTVVVAVIDTGVDYNHPDLKDRIWTNTKEIPNNGIDDDGNGYVDDIHGYDFCNYDSDPMDDYGHGTHVAGTIATSANTIGVVGVAPNVKIMPLKFISSDGYGWNSDAILAIDYAKKMGAKISNNSWGGSSYNQALYDSIKNYGGLFVAAAGNASTDTDGTPQYPSCYNLPNILSVAAIDNTGALAWFSNYGLTSVDVAAPGQNIYSTIPSNSYAYYSGTSMATPHVAGVAALVLSKYPSSTTANIKDSIMKSVVKISSLTGKVASGGMVNANSALSGDDDIPGVPISSSITGTLNSTSDRDDVFNISLVKGDYITITLTGATDTDFDLYLYNKNATTVKSNVGILAYSEGVGTSTETVKYLIKEDGTYYVDVYAFSGTGSYTLKYSKGLGAGSYEDNSGKLLFNGTWQKISNSNTSGGTYTSTNTAGSSMTATFVGTGVNITALKSNTQGIAKITIDGTTYTADLYSASTVYKSTVFSKTGLKSGSHTLKIEWTGLYSKYARKTISAKINIDAITVIK